MNGRVRWLRISYRTGAVIDALAAIQMLVPSVFAATNRLSGFRPPWEYKYAMGMGASLMLGWTALLLWADRRPVERRGVLILTVFPVVVGLVANELWALSSGFISLGALVPVLVGQAALVGLFVVSYLRSVGESVRGGEGNNGRATIPPSLPQNRFARDS